MTRPSLVLAAASALLTLGACGSGSDDGSSTAATTAPAAEESAADPCGELRDLGITGADFGPIPTFGDVADIREQITMASAISEVEPPVEVVEAWETRLAYLARVGDDIEAAADGSGDPSAAQPTDEEAAAGEELTDWWFATCES